MRKVVLALLLTAVGLGLLLSFKSRAATATGTTALGGSALSGSGTTTAPTGAASPTPSATASASASASTSTSTSAAKTGSGGKNGTYTGAAESTQFGNVQVQAVISGGKLTNVVVLQVPDRGGYEGQIVQIALPELKSEALSAQSANIDVISGATYTSQGYAESLQSALDQAGL
ncbi:MAG TPA: FMN-binding protein [Actinospica sp.]|jgi:uncharacterized protein with FMN-binding domain|nr:FMN-binding protein [Actinospica sp.]